MCRTNAERKRTTDRDGSAIIYFIFFFVSIRPIARHTNLHTLYRSLDTPLRRSINDTHINNEKQTRTTLAYGMR